MSEIATTDQPIVLANVTRGEYTLPLHPEKRLKGKKKGQEYPTFVAKTPEQQELLLNWLGREKWFSIVQSWFKTYCLNVVKEFTNEETGEPDFEAAWKALADLSCRGETMGELLEHLFDLQAKFMAAVDAGDAVAAKKYGTEYRTLKAAYDGKRRAKAEKKAKDDDDDDTNQEAPGLMGE